jgi:hypothetical protein
MGKKEDAIEYLKGIQLDYLKRKHGFDYVPQKDDFATKDDLYNFVDNYIESKKDLSEDEKINIEIELKENILDSIFLNTEYENYFTWKILQNSYDNFIKLNPNLSFEGNLFLGTITSNEINAEFISKEDNDVGVSYILFDIELTIAILLLSKIVVQSLPLIEQSPYIRFPIDLIELFKNVGLNKTIKDRILNCMYFSIYKRPSLCKDYLIENDLLEILSLKIIESAELFIVSHEIGHYLHEDVYKSDIDNDTSLDEIEKNWDREYKADLYALNQLVKLYRKQKDYFTLLGPEVYFNFMIIYEKFKVGLDNKSHPPSSKRLEYHRTFLGNFLDEKEQVEFAHYQAIIDRLFNYYELVLTEFIKFKRNLDETPSC